MGRIIDGEFIDKFKSCEMLQSVATISVVGWLINARLVRKIARAGISQLWVIKMLLQVQMFNDMVEFE